MKRRKRLFGLVIPEIPCRETISNGMINITFVIIAKVLFSEEVGILKNTHNNCFDS